MDGLFIKTLRKLYNKVSNIQNEREYNQVFELIKDENFLPVRNIPVKIKSVAFIVPGIKAYAGGTTSILRLGTELVKNGFDVSYISFVDQSIDDMKSNAAINLISYQGNMKDKSSLYTKKYDAVIATNWKSVYITKKINSYRLYFVQDYEPYFYGRGDYYFLSELTYQMNLHMISLGAWNKRIIAKESGVNVKDIIDFPYESKEYGECKRNYISYKNKREFTIAVYIKSEIKRLPLTVQTILINLEKEFLLHDMKLNVLYFGNEPHLKIRGGTKLGKLNKSQLKDLYCKSDFGMVASMTNISLVPYEMVATGLPLIEFENGSISDFFPNGSYIASNFNYRDLFIKLQNYIANPEMIVEMQEMALAYISKFSWTKTGKQFADILTRVGNGNNEHK